MEGVGEDLDVGGSFQLVSAVHRDVETHMITIQKRHLGLCILFTKWKLFFSEVDPRSYTPRQWIILQNTNAMLAIFDTF